MQNPRYLRFSIIFILMHSFIALLLSSITAFAPDENFYVSLLENSYSINRNEDNPVSWANSSPIFIKLVYIPAYILNLIGMSPLMSLRALSITTSLGAMLLVLKFAEVNGTFSKPKKFLTITLMFTPSIVLWQSLALRESIIYLILSLFFYFILTFQKKKPWLIFVLATILASSLLFTKDYLYVQLLATFLMSLIIYLIRNRAKTFLPTLILLSILLPMLLFPSQLAGILSSFQSVGVNRIASESVIQPDAQLVNQGQTTYLLKKNLDENKTSLSYRFLNSIGAVAYLENIVQESLNQPSKSRVGDEPNKLLVNRSYSNLSMKMLTGSREFLFIPFPLIDNGSLFLNLQSLEMPFWLLLYTVYLVTLIRNWKKISQELGAITVTLFPICFLLVSSIVEVNDGTSLRHRSVLLIPVLYLFLNYRSTKNSLQLFKAKE